MKYFSGRRLCIIFVLLVVVVLLFGSNQLLLSIQVQQLTDFQDGNSHHVHQPSNLHPTIRQHEESNYSLLTPPPKSQDHPVLLFRKGLRSTLPFPIPVVLWPFMDSVAKKANRISADVMHIEVNGVEESSVLKLANASIRTLDPYVIWVTDAKFPYAQWCTRLADKAHKVFQWRQQQNYSPLVWPIYVVDFTDPPESPKRCPGLEEVVGHSHVLYFKRSIVVDRTWNFTSNWLQLGQPLNTHGFQQTPLIVRTDIVEGIATHCTARNLTHVPRHQNRLVDVAHYWPPSTEVAQFSNLRNRVSTWLLEHFGSHYRVICEMVGQHDRVGRRQAQQDYIMSMIQTKIIVVAQRDTYEDHFRLYEALSSGAMVMTDPMYTLPFQNGTHLIVYTSLPNLIHLVQHYLKHDDERLAIAEAGYTIAMSRHRSWHRMEEIILGRPMTICEKQDFDHLCPFTVHTRDWLLQNKSRSG